jgi:hypothetical protein
MSFLDASHLNVAQGNPEKTVIGPSSENEATPDSSIAAATADWTADEERHLVRNYAKVLETLERSCS